MATLTETAYYARKGVNIFIIAIVVIIVGRFLLLGAIDLKNALFPAPPPPANNAFGPLPFPNSEGAEATPSGLTYSLETVDGSLPAMPATVKVFSLAPDTRASFGTFDRMKETAAKLGFTGEPQKTGSTVFEFTDPNNSLKTLAIDELSGDFQINYNYGSDLSVFNEKEFRSQNDVIAKAKAFFEDLGLYTPDLATGSAEVSYLKLDGQNLIPTTSLSNADAVSVNFKRADIDETPIVYPNAKNGPVSALIIGSQNQENSILQARYYHSVADTDNAGTYDPITIADAYERLQKGNAIFSSLPNPLPKTIPIRSVTIGFLDAFPPQNYLQPVVIFSDDKDFQALVPAIKY